MNSRIQEKEGRISSTQDTIEETDSSVKENIKSNKSLTQNIQEIWDTMKRPSLRIIGIEEGEVQLIRTHVDKAHKETLGILYPCPVQGETVSDIYQ